MIKKYKKKLHKNESSNINLFLYLNQWIYNIYNSNYFWPVCVSIVIGLFIFAQSFRYEFLSYDDERHILENPYFHPLTLQSLWYLWTHSYFGLYVPFVYTVWGLAYQISQKSWWFHVINFNFHILNSILVFTLILTFIKKYYNKIILDSAHIIAIALAIAIFTTHPLQVHAITWISELRGLLAVFLGISAIYFWFLNTRLSYVFSILCFTLGMLSKPSISYIPAILVVLVFLSLSKPFRFQSLVIVFNKTICYFISAFVVIFLNKQIQSDEGSIEYFPTIFEKIKIATTAFGFYLKNLIWPSNLMPIYLRSAKFVVQQESWDWVGMFLILTLIIIAIISFIKRKYLIFLGIAMIFLGVGPVLGFINFKYQNFSIVSDHYFYFSIAGVCVALSGIILELKPFSYLYNILLIFLISVNIIFTMISFNQVKMWANDDTFYLTLIDKNPNHYIAYSVLGNMRSKQLKFDEALRYLYKAYELNKEHYLTHQNLGVVLLNTRQFQKIIELSKEWFPINEVKLKSYASSIAHMYFNVGVAYYMLKQFSNAKFYFEQSINLSHFNYTHEAYKFLGDIYYQELDYTKAKANYTLYLQSAPPHDKYRAIVIKILQELNQK